MQTLPEPLPIPEPPMPVFEPPTSPTLIEEKVQEIPPVFEPLGQKFVPIIEKEELPELTFEPEIPKYLQVVRSKYKVILI